MKDLADDVFERELAPIVMREAMTQPVKVVPRTGQCGPSADKCPRCQLPFSNCTKSKGGTA